MAHYDKHTFKACGHLCKHYERGKEDSGDYVKFGNMDIDPERTPLNYNLAPAREQGHYGYIKHRTSEVKLFKRPDVNVMCSWVVTVPRTISEDEYRLFFEESYKFLENRYGEKNVISAYVHMDETTPHMHFAFVPVVIDKKKGIEKVSAKERVDKFELKAFHGDLSAYMEKIFGYDIGILNEATKEGNRTTKELKRDTAIQLMEDVEKARTELLRVQQGIKESQEKKIALKRELEALEGRVLTAQEVKATTFQKTALGGIKGLSHEDMVNLKKTAEKVGKVSKDLRATEKARDNALTELSKSADREKNLKNKIKQLENERPFALQQIEINKLKQENTELKEKVSFFQSVIDTILSIVPQIREQILKRFPQLNPSKSKNNQDIGL